MIQTFPKNPTTNTCHCTNRPTPRNPPSKTIQPSTPLGLRSHRQPGHRSGVHVAVRRLGSYGLPSFRWNRGPLERSWFGFLLCGFWREGFFLRGFVFGISWAGRWKLNCWFCRLLLIFSWFGWWFVERKDVELRGVVLLVLRGEVRRNGGDVGNLVVKLLSCLFDCLFVCFFLSFCFSFFLSFFLSFFRFFSEDIPCKTIQSLFFDDISWDI